MIRAPRSPIAYAEDQVFDPLSHRMVNVVAYADVGPPNTPWDQPYAYGYVNISGFVGDGYSSSEYQHPTDFNDYGGHTLDRLHCMILDKAIVAIERWQSRNP
jgi:hypothetical protein